MKLVILGIIGPVQLILFGSIILGLIASIVFLIKSNSKNKAKAETLNSVLDRQSKPNVLDALERLEKLKKSGSLTDAEFETEKRKLLNN